MQKEIVMVIAENIDTIVNIYKMSRDKDRRLIEEHIKKAIIDIRDNEKQRLYIPPAGFSNDIGGLTMDLTSKLTKACFLPGRNDSFRPKSTLHKFCSMEFKKEWER